MLSGVRQTPTTQKQPAVIEVDEASFEQEVIARSRDVPVVIDFWAPWCGPCRTLGPTLERLASEAKGAWVLAKVNVDESQRLAAMFRVQSIPAVKAIYNGKVIDEFVGALPETEVRAWLKRIVPEPGNTLLEAAQALEATSPQEAAARYRLILGDEPQNADVMFSLGRLLLLEGEDEGVTTLHQVPVGTPFYARAQALLPLASFFAEAADAPDELVADDTATRYRQAAQDARKGDYGAAMEMLLVIVGRDRAFHDDGARKTLLGLFALLGDNDPLVPAFRRRLANTLF